MKRKVSILLIILFLGGNMTAVSAQGCYDAFRQKGYNLLKQGKCEEAIVEFNRAKNCADYDSKNNDLDKLIKQAETCKKAIPELDVSPMNLTVPSSGDIKILKIKSSNKWKVEDLPDWCEILEETRTVLKIACNKNEQAIQRTASFSIVAGNLSKLVHIDQAAAEIPMGKISFRTNVRHALVDWGLGQGAQPIVSAIEMKAGEYPVKITKDKYLPVDTIVSVPGDGSTNTVDIAMKPDFAVVKLEIATADGLPFQKYPTMTIGTKQIDLTALYDNSTLLSMDEAEQLDYFNLYKDGYLLLQEGTYNIGIVADGFEEYTGKIQAVQGNTITLKTPLNPVSGYLTIIDKGGATGAKVFLNNTEIGTVPVFKKGIRIGTHTFRFEKEGFITPDENYPVEIEKSLTRELDVSMHTFTKYRFSSDPAGAEIFVNGKRSGFTPSDSILLKEGSNTVEIKKNGFWDYKKVMIADKNNKQSTIIDVKLEPVFPVTINSEEKDLSMIITRNGDTVSSGKTTPAELQLPLGKYKLELYEDNSKRYSGSFTHATGQDLITVPVFSKGTFTTLVADLFTASPKAETKTENGKSLNYYNLMYNFQFGRFNLFPGFSTSILRSSMFGLAKDFKKEMITTDPASEIVNTNEETYPGNLFSLSCLFLNGEFRIGAYPNRYLGVCALGSYVWYPPLSELKDVFQFSHISGQEIFIGIELTSRIPYFNANIKLGQEIYNGKYNYWVQTNNKEKSFFSSPFTVSNFVITVGITLGNKVSKSNNMLRVW